MGRRQPEVQGHQRGLGQETGGHQCRGNPGHRPRTDTLGQQRDIQRAVGAIEQHGTEQVKDRSEQCEDQVAQGCAQGFRAPVQ
jgi:hypothetical protein